MNIPKSTNKKLQLTQFINSPGIKQFLLKNLTREPDGTYHWKFNLAALNDNYENNILSAINSDIPFEGETLFIRGENSDYITFEDWPQILQLFPNANLSTVNDAGHWVHADNPQSLIKIIQEFL